MQDSLSAALASTHLTPSTTPTTTTPSGKSLPTTLTRSYNILGVPTDAYCQVFQERIVVGVTQLNLKIGNYVYCQASKSPVDQSVDFHIDTLLGNRDEALLGVYARRITERLIQLQARDPMVVLLGISLKGGGKNPDMFRHVVDAMVQLICDALKMAASGQENWEALD
jgi:hypothetical protein